MATYRIGREGCAPKDGNKLEPGSLRVVPDDFRPSGTWTPVDEAARAAFELKFGPNAPLKADPSNVKAVRAEKKRNALFMSRAKASAAAPEPVKAATGLQPKLLSEVGKEEKKQPRASDKPVA